MTVSKYVNREDDLLNCPLCGNIATFLQHDDGVDYGQIVCIGCFITTSFGNRAKCKDVWNRRVDFPMQLIEWFV